MMSAIRSALVTVLLVLLAASLFVAPAFASTIGYVYAGSGASTTSTALQRFDVADSGELTLVGDTTVSNRYIFGVAVAHTTSGVYVYALDVAAYGDTEATIDEFKVNPADGSLTSIGSLPAPEICTEAGNRLYVYDNQEAGPARLYSQGCSAAPAAGVRQFTIDTSTGALHDDGHIYFGGMTSFAGMGIAGNELTFAGNTATQTQIEYGTIASNGEVAFGLPFGLDDGAATGGEQRGSVGASDPGLFSLGNLHPISQLDTSDSGEVTFGFGGGLGNAVVHAPRPVSTLGYTSTALVAGEQGPQLEIFGKNQVAQGTTIIDLNKPPTSIPFGSQFSPNFPETVYALGPFFYVGIYGSRTVQLLDAPGEPIQLMPTPFVSGNGTENPDPTVTSMGGYLFGSPGEGGPPPGGSGSGTPASGKSIIKLSGNAQAKLKSGAIKVDVNCGLPCTVAGAIFSPGAQAASARKPKPLSFKSVKLPGSGKTVLVSLKFTRAQKNLVVALLRKHKKVRATITVTEAAGGALPQSKSVRIT